MAVGKAPTTRVRPDLLHDALERIVRSNLPPMDVQKGNGRCDATLCKLTRLRIIQRKRIDHVHRTGMNDIFRFWSRIERGAHIYPEDAHVFARLSRQQHGLNLRCLPAAFAGPLKTAKVVLLFAAPGFNSESDLKDAKTKDGKDYYMRRWKGPEPFRDKGSGGKWFRSIVKFFGDPKEIEQKFAVLNVGAYQSPRVKDWRALMSLPSSRVSVNWTQSVLFPRAESAEIVVICMRAASAWGLERGREYGGTLFAPVVNVQRGYLAGNSAANGRLVELVRERVASRR
ncbi:hypothetical protein [Bradyrhizobium yuanmingense]|uniref:hypothetical protein n=1 Tax=Bradyrhizobium TaxID=374 RepID=UPI00138AB52A|nr:hypothetical protein [Bradyrhizobium yuanmingense]